MKKIIFWIKNTTISNKITIVVLLGVFFAAILFGKSRYDDNANKKLNSNLELLREKESSDIISVEETIEKTIEQNSDLKSEEDNSDAEKDGENSDTEENEENSTEKKESSNSEVFSKTVFIGDSWALEMKRVDYVRNYNIIAKKNQNISQCEEILKKVINLNPNNVVIMIGNDTIKSISTARFNSAYKKIIEDIKLRIPKAKIIIVSLSQKDKNNKTYNNIDIKEFNETLKKIAAERDGFFIDTQSMSNNIEKDGYPRDSFFEEIANIVKTNMKKSNK